MRRLCLLLLLACSLPALAEDGCKSKLQEFVNRSGFTVKVARPCQVWVAIDALSIPREGGLQGMLLIAQEGELGILGTVVQTKAKLSLSAELMTRLLQMNNEIEFAKVGLDSDGDLFIRAELRMNTLTEEEFKATVKNLTEASAKVYAALKK